MDTAIRTALAVAIVPLVAAIALPASRSGTVAANVGARLRQLVVAEEQYWGEHGTYTTDAAALGVFQPRVQPADSIWVQVAFAGGRGWNGVARHRGHPGKTCVIFVGSLAELPLHPTTAGGVHATDEGVPTCDEF